MEGLVYILSPPVLEEAVRPPATKLAVKNLALFCRLTDVFRVYICPEFFGLSVRGTFTLSDVFG